MEEETQQLESQQQAMDIATNNDNVDVRRTDQARLSPVRITRESNAKKQKNGRATPSSNNSRISPPREKALPTTPASKGGKPFVQKKRKVGQNLTDTPEALSDIVLNHQKIGSVLDCDRSGIHSKVDNFSLSPLSNNEGEQCDSFKQQVQCLQNKLSVQAPPHNIKEPDQQRCSPMGVEGQFIERGSHGRQPCENHLLQHSDCNEKRKSSCNEKRKKRPKEKSHAVLEPFLPSDHQRCRRNGTNWRCHQMASPGKRYCEKHQPKQDMYNEKRRKHVKGEKPSALKPFLPSDHQQCRRTGNRWRCSEMAMPWKRYCEKHQSEKDIYNEKRRKLKESSCLAASGSVEKSNSDADYLLPSDHQQCSEVDSDASPNQCDARKTDQVLQLEAGNTADTKQQKGVIGKQTTTTLETEDIVSADSGNGVSPDGTIASQSNMAIMLREESKLLSVAKCSVSMEEKRNIGDHCDNAIKDGECNIAFYQELSHLEELGSVSFNTTASAFSTFTAAE